MSDHDHQDPDDRREEPRVRDLVASDDPDELDPALIARLAAWFGEPVPDPEPPPDDPERREMLAARERALAAVQPEMVESLVGRGEHYAALLEVPTLPSPVAAEITRFDLARWGLRLAFGEREREIPEEVADALRERTPQALLRDLHRPVRHFGHVQLDEVDLGVDLAGARARALVVETITALHAIRLDEEPNPRRFMREDRARLRSILDAPWQDSKPARPRPAGALSPDELPPEIAALWAAVENQG
jgi:hypothetical protein